MNDFDCKAVNGKVTITGFEGPGGDIVVPSMIGGSPVVAIGSWAFGGNPHITSITLPPSVIDIGEKAFKNCSGLTRVTIPETTLLQEYVFIGCDSLTSISHGEVYTAEDEIFHYYTGTLGGFRDGRF